MYKLFLFGLLIITAMHPNCRQTTSVTNQQNKIEELISQFQGLKIQQHSFANVGVLQILGNDEITPKVIKYGKEAVPYLLKAIYLDNMSIKLFSIYCLGEIGDGKDELVKMLQFYEQRIDANSSPWDATIMANIRLALQKINN